MHDPTRLRQHEMVCSFWEFWLKANKFPRKGGFFHLAGGDHPPDGRPRNACSLHALRGVIHSVLGSDPNAGEAGGSVVRFLSGSRKVCALRKLFVNQYRLFYLPEARRVVHPGEPTVHSIITSRLHADRVTRIT